LLSLSRPMGRMPFLFGISAVNLAILFTAILALVFLPTGGGHLAVVIVIGALQVAWLALHARRFADAGRSATWPILMFLLSFTTFVIGYLIFAALWSSPEVQKEAFRTAGGIGADGFRHVETNPMVLEAGRMFTGILGAAGAVVLSGMILFGFGVVAFTGGCFSLLALALPSGLAPAAIDMRAAPKISPFH
jgi:uncharacterized membrane protein YhaH (DUF805 family)